MRSKCLLAIYIIKYGDDQEKVEKRFTKIGKDNEL